MVDLEQGSLPATPKPGTPPLPMPERLHQRLLRVLAHNMHFVTFLPLIIMSVLQDVHLFLAALISTCLVVTFLLVGFILHRNHYIKAYPKPYDLFNVALYGSMIPLALCAHNWLLRYVSVLTNGGNMLFMWTTILLPCMDNFVMLSVRDRVPDFLISHPLLRRMALLVSCTWASALSIMTLGAILKLRFNRPGAANIVFSYVLGFGPLLLAFPVQHVITAHYKKRMMAQKHAHEASLLSQQQREEAQAAAADAEAAEDVPDKTGHQQQGSIGTGKQAGGAGKQLDVAGSTVLKVQSDIV